MKIESLDRNIKQVLETGYYTIPRFQRPFSWEKEQVEDFWTDTIAGESDYFIGSMVVFREKEGVFGIVDGQQRLTTITMMLCALRNSLDRDDFKAEAKGVHRLIERENIDNKLEFVLQSETSYPFLQEHIQKYGSPDVGENVGEEERLLKTAYGIITSNINDIIKSVRDDPSIGKDAKKQRIQEKLVEVRGLILGLKVIYITLDTEDDAYVIFETLNTRGKDLTVADLLKSHLTKLLRAKNVKVDVTKDKWTKMVKRIETIGPDRKVDEYLYHFWLSKYERYVPAKKLFKSMKREVNRDNAKEFLDELDKDSILYAQMLTPTRQQWKKHERAILDSLRALEIFRVKQPIPMLLSIMRDYRNGRLKPKQTLEILDAIEKFHFIFSAITSQRSSGGISSMYTTRAIELANSETLEERLAALSSLKIELVKRIPPYQEFEVDFAAIGYSEGFEKHKRLIQYILAKIGSHFEKGLPIDYEQMTIEHLAAQNPKDGHQIPAESVAKIGNLILVSSELNGRLGNKPFIKKKKILDDSPVWQDEVLKGATDWGEGEIEKRTMLLANLAYNELWKL